MAAPHPRGSAAVVEGLEPRQFLSVTLDEGTLQVLGTHKNDKITITIDDRTPDQISVEINRFIRRFALTDVEQIYVQAGQGDDYVVVDSAKKDMDQPTRLYGSGGNDTILGGYGKDRIYGGSQNDRISGNDSRDIIYGEAGDDTLLGGRGSDYLNGGDDNDSLVGGLGLDSHWGETGDDTIDSVDGFTDYVNGGEDVDTASADKVDEVLTSIERRRDQ